MLAGSRGVGVIDIGDCDLGAGGDGDYGANRYSWAGVGDDGVGEARMVNESYFKR